jgi:peptidylprolyl isomerase
MYLPSTGKENDMGVTKSGDRVQIHYTGRLEDGTVFDSSEGRDPLEFTAGGHEVIPGVDRAVLGMQQGESKTVVVSVEEAYGARKPGLEQRIPRTLLPEGVQVGDRLQAKVGEDTILVSVAELGEEFAVMDANHPLAGESLIFDIEIVSVESKEG